LHWPLMDVLRLDFLATAGHYDELHAHGRQFAGLLTTAALDPGSVLSRQELRRAFKALPDEAMAEVVQTLTHALEAAGEKRRECWENRILPFWRLVWPKDRVLSFKGSGEKVAILAIVAGDAFPFLNICSSGSCSLVFQDDTCLPGAGTSHCPPQGWQGPTAKPRMFGFGWTLDVPQSTN